MGIAISFSEKILYPHRTKKAGYPPRDALERILISVKEQAFHLYMFPLSSPSPKQPLPDLVVRTIFAARKAGTMNLAEFKAQIKMLDLIQIGALVRLIQAHTVAVEQAYHDNLHSKT